MTRLEKQAQSEAIIAKNPEDYDGICPCCRRPIRKTEILFGKYCEICQNKD